MPYIIKGWNDFYEGWLANCFGLPCNENRNTAWKEGWKMGEETGATKMLALGAEITRDDTNHIEIEEQPQ